jgi:hypothetical protein
LRGLAYAEVSRGGFECAQSIERGGRLMHENTSTMA